MHPLIADSSVSAWTSGAAILTFVFPMLLFIAVAGALYVLYTKPEPAPGNPSVQRPVSYTSIPGQPTVDVSGVSAAARSETSAAQNETGAAESENLAPKGDE